MRPMTPQNNKGIWCLIRFVPKAYKHVDRRKKVQINTTIRVADDPAGIRAYEAVQALNSELEAYWQGLVEGTPRAPVSAENARAHAARMGLRYRPVAELAEGPLDEIVRRVAALVQRGEVDAPKAVTAALGGPTTTTKIALSSLLAEYEADQKTALSKYSPDQLRRWRNNKKRAIENLKKVLGRDAYVDEISRSDALDFRDWWQDRIVAGDVQIASANKEIGIISRMLHVLNRSRRLNMELVFKELCIEGGTYQQRTPYTVEFVQDRILAPGALDGLNKEARGVVYVCAELGLRPVEVVNLSKNAINLSCKVPHILVMPEERILKTDYSERQIPLVGVALMVMQEFPEGFPTYFDKSPSLSATVNKFLKANKLRPTDRHSLYSLRHTFEDRLTAVEPPEKIQAYLMGHKYDRPKYGSPPSLEQLHGWLSKIAFRAPPAI